MKEVLIVFAGGGLGSVCRYLINRYAATVLGSFPFSTLLANVLACLILGFIAGSAFFRGSEARYLYLLCITGFCGGLSTFSTFSAENLELFRHGMHGLAFINIIANFILSMSAVSAGWYLAKLAG